jgi:adenosylhomocysteine nucleosidase
VLGGHGVSGQAFVDNAAFREYVRKTFDANVLDMESASAALLAYANKIPFIAFRSLSDLVGGGTGANEMGIFFQLASDNSAAFVREFLKRLPRGFAPSMGCNSNSESGCGPGEVGVAYFSVKN